METKRPFCSRPRPEYPWAEMACHLISRELIPDKPVEMTVTVKAPGFDPSVRERKAMLKNQPTVASDGLRTYLSQHDLYLQRPDGHFAHCQDYRSKSQPWLYCTATEELQPLAIIDFDSASPGPRLHDLGYAAWMWLDLGDDDIEPDLQRRRLTMFCGAYDENVDLPRVVDFILLRQRILIAQGRRVGDATIERWADDCLQWTIRNLHNAFDTSDANSGTGQ